MGQKSGLVKEPAEQVVREIRRAEWLIGDRSREIYLASWIVGSSK